MTKTFFVIMLKDKPKYVCDCPKRDAEERVRELRRQYNLKHKVRSAWKNAVKIELVEVQGDRSFEPPPVLELDDIVEGEIIDE